MKRKNIITECSCGEQHEFDKDILKKMNWNSEPEYLECSECPVCTPELLDKPEDHEDEAYVEDINIEDLEKSIEEGGLEDFDEMDDEGFEELEK